MDNKILNKSLRFEEAAGATAMRNPQHFTTLPDLDAGGTCSSAFLTQCHRNALDRLDIAFKERRPLAILVGEGRSASRFVVRKFLSRLDPSVAEVRIPVPCLNTTEFMGKIIAAVGLQPKDMKLADLDSVFSMFLSFQKAHRHRTIICVEEAENCDWWVLDKIRDLVEAERENSSGLMVLLSGQSGLNDLLTQRPLNSIAGLAGKRISLLPYTLSETREYLRRRVDAEGIGSVDAAFDYHAIPLIHELCAGVPDAVSELYSQCRQQAAEEGVSLISKGLVKRAYELQRELTAQSYGEDDTTTVNISDVPARPGRLIVQLKGHEVREIALRRGNILIGRSRLCDIVVDSRIVSRHHALISYGPKGATIIDLGSTNGTMVDGYPVKEHLLSAGETIEVGDCTIEYIYDDALHGPFRDAELLAKIELSP